MRILETMIALTLVVACADSIPVHGDDRQSAGGVSVAPADRAVVDFALAHSPTFREQYELAANLPGIEVRLASTPGRALGGWPVVAKTGWVRGSNGERESMRTILCRVRHSGFRELAARMAHELVHASELARFGSIDAAPTFERDQADGEGETSHAVEIEKRVRRELQGAPWQVASIR